MAKCSNCGRRGFLLKLDWRGWCPTCVAVESIKRRKKEEAAAEQREAEQRWRQQQAVQQESGQREHQWQLENTYQTYDSFNDEYAKHERLFAIEKRYEDINKRHYELIQEKGVAYTIANNLSMPDSPEMDKVIDLCNEDIRLSKLFKAYWEEVRKAECYEGAYDRLPVYPSFKRLAIIYEKRKDYDKAISICQQAIELGYVNDGTDGQMPGRMARLMRKAGNQKNKLSTNETIDSTFRDGPDDSIN